MKVIFYLAGNLIESEVSNADDETTQLLSTTWAAGSLPDPAGPYITELSTGGQQN